MINEILSLVSSFALKVIESTGYAGIFILSFLESAAIPIPSEVVVPFSGFLAAQGVFNFWGVVFVATLANLVGSIALFWIGKSGGRWILEKYGKYVLITERELETGDSWFKKHGVKAIFWGRMLPVIRTFVSLPAGIAGMNFWRFCVFTFAGALPWNFTLAYIGLKAGENWMILHDYLHEINYIIIALIIVGAVWFVYRHRSGARLKA